MSGLREWERNFRDAIFQGGTPDGIRTGGLPAERRFAIYRNNCLQGLAEALRDGFPVVCQLIGTECFDGVARRFVEANPPSSGCLLDYGAEFSGFIETDPATAHLAYLPDVAQLEWAWHEAFHAADEPSWSLSEMAAVPLRSLSALYWRLHASVRLLDSPWPLERIYQINQPGDAGDGSIDLSREQGGPLLVFRPEGEVLIKAMNPADYAFLAALAIDGDLDRAVSAAFAVEPAFDPGAGLVRLFTLGVFGHPAAPGFPSSGISK